MNDFKSQAEVDYFCTLIKPKIGLELHITFIDTRIVSSKVVEALAQLNNNKQCKVYVLHRYLYSYLYNLSIGCVYIEPKTLSTENASCSSPSVSDMIIPEQISDFLNKINEQYGYDYTQYQIESIIRRIRIAMKKENIQDFNKYSHAVLQNEHIFEQLFLEFSINTTEFFRDPELYAEIKNTILPSLNSFSHLKIWCVGCSIGKEPYSLAFLLDECGMLNKTQIYATDINPYVLEEAKNGLFSIQTLEKDMNNYREANGSKNFVDYFELKQNYIKVKERYKKNILFFQHNLVNSTVFNEFHLILCRNVLIYFNSTLQQSALKHFYNSLTPNGFLVLGKSEGLIQNRGYSYFNKYNENLKVYTKKAPDEIILN